MKVYVCTDIEGVSGVCTFYVQTSPEGKYFEDARKLLTAEINAAVAGMVEMEVEDVLILDGHGPGAVVFEDLHPPARLLHGRPLAPREIRDKVVDTFDVCMMIGQHAMAGTADGNLNHTQNSKTVDYYKLNGRMIGEIAQFALYQGATGMPLIFLSGDEAACREAEELIPEITTVAVKQGLSRNCAVSLSAEESHRRIRKGVRNAIKKHKETPVPPLKWESPYFLEKRFFHNDDADRAAATPGAERIDSQTVIFRSDDIREIIY
ncbi:MAG: M55 family metallopeptidase [Planctomycetota bacterium]|nr:M55 family metallopeptidase [Planctomycetota bacterium]